MLVSIWLFCLGSSWCCFSDCFFGQFSDRLGATRVEAYPCNYHPPLGPRRFEYLVPRRDPNSEKRCWKTYVLLLVKTIFCGSRVRKSSKLMWWLEVSFLFFLRGDGGGSLETKFPGNQGTKSNNLNAVARRAGRLEWWLEVFFLGAGP